LHRQRISPNHLNSRSNFVEPQRRNISLRNELLFLYPIMWLNALGIYTGRYLRYNSWDLLTDPFQLLSDIAGMIIHPLRHQVAWDMILCFSILMTLMYLMMKKVHKALI